VHGSDPASLLPQLKWTQVAGWTLCTVPAGALGGAAFYPLLVAQISASPSRYYSYESPLLEQLAVGASFGGMWMAVTLPLTWLVIMLWTVLSRRRPVLESRRLSVLIGMLFLALPSSCAALLTTSLTARVTRALDVCVWLAVVASLWLPRAVIPALAPLGLRARGNPPYSR
jgi:hypothetical protein